ncbi:MAG: DUF4097 family beta strand repeat protein [Clostridia bacterium]|nr:DUF4097 family beta strand repeat protein [Clostridia bacterium]
MKRMKIVLWIGAALLFLGALIFTISFALSGFNFEFLSNVQTVSKRFEESADNPIQSIAIDFDNAEIEVRVQDNIDALAIEYPQAQNKKGENISEIKVDETQGAISIVESYTTHINLFAWNFKAPTLVVYLPQERVYALDLQTTTGAIRLCNGNLNVSKITLKATTGTISTKDCTVASTSEARFETTTGIVNVGELSAQTVVLQTTTGRLTAHKTITAENSISLATTTGSIETQNTITADTVIANATTGDLKINADIYANRITLATTTGDLNARIGGKKADYSILVSHSTGDSNVSKQTGGTKTLNVSCTTGDIYVIFAE